MIRNVSKPFAFLLHEDRASFAWSACLTLYNSHANTYRVYVENVYLINIRTWILL